MSKATSSPKQLAIFWGRFAGYLASGTIAPIVVFASKFGLFKETHYEPIQDELGNVVTTTAPALNGWGIVSCLLVGLTLISILKEVIKAYSGYSLPKQVLSGIVNSVIPLVIALCVCYFLDGVLDSVKYCLAVLIVTKIVSIPLNPLPKWRYEKNGIENYDDFINTVANYLKSRKE